MPAKALVRSRASVTLATVPFPSLTAEMERSIKSLVALAASSDLDAKLRTSSATTAKPLPEVPARAASTAAFKARMLVWKAISSIVAMMTEISSEEWEIFSIALLSSPTYFTLVPNCAPACSTKWPASSAAEAVRLALEEMSVIVAASSCTELACMIEPWLKVCAPVETWPLAADTCPAAPSIWRMVALN